MPSAVEAAVNAGRDISLKSDELIVFPAAQSSFLPRAGDCLAVVGSSLSHRLGALLGPADHAQGDALATLGQSPAGLLQELRRAASGTEIAPTAFIPEGRSLIDPAMGVGAGAADAETLIRRRRNISERLKAALQARALLIVLAHTETWIDETTGEALSVRPGAEVLRRLPQRFAFKPTSHGKVVDDIAAIHRLLLEHGPADAHLLLAIDPTPLAETNGSDDPIVASMATKATLRSAMAEAVRALPGVDYVPILESALWSEPLAVWNEARTEISDAMVATLAERLRARYLAGEPPRAAAKGTGLVEQLTRGVRPAEPQKPAAAIMKASPPPPAGRTPAAAPPTPKRLDSSALRAVPTAQPTSPPKTSAPAAAKTPAPAASPAGAPGERRFLFIAGCPRSGTTALGDLLNVHDRVAIGKERFKNLLNAPNLDPPYGTAYYTAERFFDLRETDTNIRDDKLYQRLAAKYANCLYVGDKVPRYYARLNILSERFPSARFLVITRKIEEVAQSWEARAKNPSDHWPEANGALKAVEHWNEANRKTLAWMRRLGDQLRVVHYERLFSGNRESLLAILDWLGLEMTKKLDEAFTRFTADWNTRASRPSRLTPEQQSFIAENADQESYQALVAASV